MSVLLWAAVGLGGLLVLPPLAAWLAGVRYIPNDKVGIVEKLWSRQGSVAEGRLIASRGEAGYEMRLLRGGLHFGFWPWQYRIHKTSLTVVPQGKIGYVFARDGRPVDSDQTLARVVECNDFQDARTFLSGKGGEHMCVGQRGRQRAILREGVYAINLALFVVITEDCVYRLGMMSQHESQMIDKWRQMLQAAHGFDPIVVGAAPIIHIGDPDDSRDAGDTIGVVTVHDGPTLDPGQIIAPPVGLDDNAMHHHSNFQDIEAFLRAGGRRGRQFAVLTDGTYFINRWFASVELIPKKVVPIGHVGVVVSYFGKEGSDLSGDAFRHGERVASGERGVQASTLSPGKYAFNDYAGHVHLVPTTNFVLHWITGRTESHKYDESLKSIDLVTADAYEPALPLSVVVHIDYQKAASVVQRFGDVKKLITQTLDPLLSAYFRDIAHKKTMLELLHDRDSIQAEARHELQRKFSEFDIELVDVLIGKPETQEATGEIELLLEQLRLRQLSQEQVLTYQQQCAASEKLKTLKMAQAQAEMQTDLTRSKVEIEIAKNRGEAELEQARMRAEQTVVDAEAEHRKHLLMAEAEGKAKTLLGEGESTRVALEGEAQASVLRKQIDSYGDPRLYAVSMVSKYLARSRQPLVPQQVFTSGAAADGNCGRLEQGPLSILIELLLAEKLGLDPKLNGNADSMEHALSNATTSQA
ncbi:MAG: hypothetical protein H6822_11695 [Planctomycetaceae bacterium]|nr:hypothetical protein [Planctomycetales bacterium]MCB9922839.1 hypothetical protein [Planctomycetaceae bacterium]